MKPTDEIEVDVAGSGPDLVVLHGWALHCGLFDGIADALSQRFRVHFIDLPGHGHNRDIELSPDIDDVARRVLEAAPENAAWLGWSLGGAVALAAAMLEPDRIGKLVTVTSTPKFVAGDNWPHAVQEDTVNRMAADLRNDFHGTVRNFLSLQVLGGEQSHAVLRELRDKAYAHGEPNPSSLVNGLQILRDTDLRARLGNVRAPLLAIMGARDRLAPPGAGEALADLVPDGRCVTIARAAHAPFISHREEFLEQVNEFLDTN